MPFNSKRADLLERSLHGPRSVDQEIRDLVGTVGRIPSLTSAASTPRPEFVSALGLALRAEALTLPAREVRPAASTDRVRPPVARPMVFVLGRGLPRIVAGVTASLLLVGAIVGGASRSALPGSLLYPVKALLDSAAVQLSGSDFDRGMTLLSQAQSHVGDAAALVDRDGAQADPDSVDEALLAAYDAVTGGQRALLGDFDRTGNPQSLIAVQDFATRVLPEVAALRPLVPLESRPDVDALITLLRDSASSVSRKAVACGLPCASLDLIAPGNTSLTGPQATLSNALPGAGVVPGATGSTGVTGPGGVVLNPTIPGGSTDGQPLPTDGGVSVGVPGVPLPTEDTSTVPLLNPTVPLIVSTSSGTTTVVVPSVVIGSLTVSPSPIVIPSIPLPTILPPLATVTPILPTGLLGLP